MRLIMTIPFLVMVISALALSYSPKLSTPVLVRMCEIVFAASVLVVLWSTMNKLAF